MGPAEQLTTRTRAQTPALAMRPGRWLDNRTAEDPHFGEGIGRETARVNLKWSILQNA